MVPGVVLRTNVPVCINCSSSGCAFKIRINTVLFVLLSRAIKYRIRFNPTFNLERTPLQSD